MRDKVLLAIWRNLERCGFKDVECTCDEHPLSDWIVVNWYQTAVIFSRLDNLILCECIDCGSDITVAISDPNLLSFTECFTRTHFVDCSYGTHHSSGHKTKEMRDAAKRL